MPGNILGRVSITVANEIDFETMHIEATEEINRI